MRYVACIFATLILIAGALAIVGSEWVGQEIRLDQKRVQAGIEEKLPFQGKSLGITYEVDNVQVGFREDGRFDLMASVNVDVRGRTAEAMVSMTSGLDYKQHSGSFYLSDITLGSVQWQEVRTKKSDKALASKVLDGLSKFGITRDAVGTLMEPYEAPLKQSLKGLAEDNLASVKVYQLGEGVRGSLIARAVSDVTVEKNTLVISLSWAEAFTRVAMYLFFGFLLVVISWYMFRYAFSTSRGGDSAFTVVAEGVGAIGGAFLD